MLQTFCKLFKKGLFWDKRKKDMSNISVCILVFFFSRKNQKSFVIFFDSTTFPLLHDLNFSWSQNDGFNNYDHNIGFFKEIWWLIMTIQILTYQMMTILILTSQMMTNYDFGSMRTFMFASSNCNLNGRLKLRTISIISINNRTIIWIFLTP